MHVLTDLTRPASKSDVTEKEHLVKRTSFSGTEGDVIDIFVRYFKMSWKANGEPNLEGIE